MASTMALVNPARSPSLPVPKREALVVGVVAGVAIGQRGEQQRAGMGRHVQPVGDQRDRAEHQAAGDLGDHHEAAQRDHHPGAALVLLVAFAEKNVVVGARQGFRHGRFRRSLT